MDVVQSCLDAMAERFNGSGKAQGGLDAVNPRLRSAEEFSRGNMLNANLHSSAASANGRRLTIQPNTVRDGGESRCSLFLAGAGPPPVRQRSQAEESTLNQWQERANE
jgi:hypothetical protein